MKKSNSKMVVRNMAQKISFMCEMQGQLSDGMWENTRPHNHWKVWCDVKWNDVTIDKLNPGVHGRLLNAIKNNYNFASNDLLSIVGDRMIMKINLWKKYGEKVETLLENDHWCIPDNVFEYNRIAKDKNDYYTKKMKKLHDAGITLNDIKEAQNGPYTMKDLKKDMADLKKIIKTCHM